MPAEVYVMLDAVGQWAAERIGEAIRAAQAPAYALAYARQLYQGSGVALRTCGTPVGVDPQATVVHVIERHPMDNEGRWACVNCNAVYPQAPRHEQALIMTQQESSSLQADPAWSEGTPPAQRDCSTCRYGDNGPEPDGCSASCWDPDLPDWDPDMKPRGA